MKCSSTVTSLLLCSKCKKYKLSLEFYASKNSKSGYMAYCKTCHKIYYKDKYKNDKDYQTYVKERTRAYHRKPEINQRAREIQWARQGIINIDGSTFLWKDFENLKIKSLNSNHVIACMLCKTTKSGKQSWHVDHDHKTGIVRGLLCSSCNMAIGQYEKLMSFGNFCTYMNLD